MSPGGRRLPAALLLALAVTACTNEGEEMTPTGQGPESSGGGATSSAPSAPVELVASVTATVEPGSAPEGFTSGLEGLLVSYSVTNEGAEPIKVATDRAAAQARSATQAPAAVWTSAGSEEDVARLSKQVFGIPDGVLPNEVHRATSVTVEPGATTEDSAFLPLPLQPELPSGGETITVTESPLTDPDAVRRLEVCVQIAPGPTPGQEEPFASTIAADAGDTALVCSEPIPLPGDER
ncbi:hypothetical protein SGUI_2880 [Serinicoccus hydrothermalis]|uniref:Lipoprotein n=1 Tax=Serinicoccus hydrothermalis TaxID=1758689 RepID=A0A1B1NFS1_9MICO|nr:hypothetical protein [Serinicoccus hydrothermalis]ANS80276.1 hypothetical protein SGUI_2880 [Serinicoccus hydrothermalis]